MTPDDQIAAAELVLGLSEGPERAAALERLLADPDFADEVARWRRWSDGLLSAYADAEPHGPVPDPDRHAPTSAAPPRASRRWPWLIGGAAGGAIAASLAALMMMPRPPVSDAPPPPAAATPQASALLAVLAPTPSGKLDPVAVAIDGDGRRVRLSGIIVVPEGRVAELWRIDAAKTPHPLGTLARQGRLLVLPQRAHPPTEGETLAISVEPSDAVPRDAPTGPVIATGSLVTT